MSADDKLTITRAQFEEWLCNEAPNRPTFASLRRHVEKPNRRGFSAVTSIVQVFAKGTPVNLGYPGIELFEKLPGDIGPMTKTEAREWILNAMRSDKWSAAYQDDIMAGLFFELGIGDEK